MSFRKPHMLQSGSAGWEGACTSTKRQTLESANFFRSGPPPNVFLETGGGSPSRGRDRFLKRYGLLAAVLADIPAHITTFASHFRAVMPHDGHISCRISQQP